MSRPFVWGDGYGKAILIGEHFVLDGATALATGLPGFVTRVGLREPVANRTNDAGELTNVVARHNGLRMLKPIGNAVTSPGPVELQASLRMVEIALARAGAPLTADVVVESTVPLSRGLGSSAAFAVAAVRAAWRYAGLGEVAEDPGVATAREMEAIAHGQSSGLDPAAAWSETLVLFRGGTLQRARPCAAGAVAQARWLILDLGAAPATREAIARANGARSRLGPARLTGWVDEVDAAARQALSALLGDDVAALAAAMTTAAEALCHLDVVDARMADVLAQCRSAGALAAKPTGAGLGGALLALAPSPRIAETVRAALTSEVEACHILEIV